tara:strand:- start:51 stop:1709 length:1659 start_codon:yes stop_codon:yes gene_type:complete
MSEEIFVNIATEIQQPYIARVPANAQQPNIRQVAIQSPAQARQPNTYQYRSPFAYNAPVSAQQPNIRDARQPFTYVRQGQTPTIYQHQTPFTYARQASQPATYVFQTTYPYVANAQTNSTEDAQQPYPYIANARQPGTYQHPSPFTYQNPSAGQEPHIKNTQQPYPYIASAQESNIANGQEPNIRNSQTPFTYQHRTPSTYQNPSNKQVNVPYIYRSPFTYRNPVNGQEPNIRDARQPASYQHRSPFTYQDSRDQQQPYPYIANARQPAIYQHQSPFTYRSPVSAQQPYPYIANSQTPFTYQHRSPFTYARQGQTPFTYNIQTPATTDSRASVSGRAPYIFDGVDGDDSGDNTTSWGPGDSNAIAYVQGVSPNGVTTNRDWDSTIAQQGGSGSHNAQVYMHFNYMTSGTYVDTLRAQWYMSKSNTTTFISRYEDYINSHSPSGIDDSWSWDVKWTSSSAGGGITSGNNGIATIPTLAVNTYHNVWNGTTATQRTFKWEASTSNQSEAEAQVISGSVQFTVRVSKSGETSLYTSTTAQSVSVFVVNTGGFGGD